jgi:general stress protein 26
LEPGGDLIAVHYTGETDYPRTGRAVGRWLDGLPGLEHLTSLVDPEFELGVWRRSRRGTPRAGAHQQQQQETDMTDRLSTVADVQDALDGERTAMVTTIDERGTLSSRPVTVQKIDDDGEVWFLVDAKADWVTPADGAAVNVAIVDDGDVWVSFAGRASVLRDQSVIEELSGAVSDAYFSADAVPAALRVVTDRIEWWTAAGTMAQLVQVGRGLVSDDRPDLGEQGTIEVGP